MTGLVSLRGISKSFSGVRVLDGVDFDLEAGEVHALLGENGAGKSTLIKIIAGVHAPDSGEMRINGQPVRLFTPRAARDAGIAIVYQELLLFPELTVAENIFANHAPRTAWGALDWPLMRARARALLDELDSPHLDVDAKVGSLSVANRQRVEIAKALSQEARVVIMDEPTASLAEADVQQLMAIVRRLRDRGVGIIYVSHKLPEIFALADRVTVLRDGAVVATRPVAQTSETALVNMMVGRSIDQLFPKQETTIGRTVLELRNVSCGNAVRDVSLELRAGEILGLAGLVGSGRTELALTIFGITPATAGEILVDGRPVRITSPDAARDLGIAYVPEDRGQQGLVRTQTIAENVSLAVLRNLARGFVLDRRREEALARDSIARLGIRARGPSQIVRQLSGGNQQKVVLAKWLAAEPKILIMDEPTRGIDVGAKSEIHALMSRLAANGLAVLMISSELPEVLGMSDRVLVMSGGRIVGRFDRAEATPEAVGAAMTLAGTGREVA
ncbi:MAG: sugar ABC transporter ATP-binding protein [Rhodospirillaceae bacterium]|nr:sugar ABC transporter ATP-binding protein [Rhodospirillaceae bacterium]